MENTPDSTVFTNSRTLNEEYHNKMSSKFGPDSYNAALGLGYDLAVEFLNTNEAENAFYYGCEGGMAPSSWADYLNEKRKQILKDYIK